MHWHILTGEYPPQAGGVSDYTRLVAQGLARAGDDVQVWAPADPRGAPDDSGVRVHRLPDHFGLRGLACLDAAMGGTARGSRLLVQYVPHMYGYKAMNLAFCAWLRLRAHRPWVMFHEVAFPVSREQKCMHNLLGGVTHAMAAVVASAAERIFVSIPRWQTTLRNGCGIRQPVRWLPVPSNVPTRIDADAVGRARSELLGDRDGVLIGHFGTFGDVVPHLLGLFPSLMRSDPCRRGVLIGRGSTTFLAKLVRHAPDLGDRVHARADLAAADVAAHLAACDLLVQPYVDGVSSRRSSIMASLALGRPVVTTYGPATEPLWLANALVEAAPVDAPAALVAIAEHLLASPERRFQLGQRARAGYDAFFSCDHTIAVLREGAEGRNGSP